MFVLNCRDSTTKLELLLLCLLRLKLFQLLPPLLIYLLLFLDFFHPHFVEVLVSLFLLLLQFFNKLFCFLLLGLLRWHRFLHNIRLNHAKLHLELVERWLVLALALLKQPHFLVKFLLLDHPSDFLRGEPLKHLEPPQLT